MIDGPLPGTDLAQAADVVLSESPLPHIPQLPDRGVGSDLIGRTAAMLEREVMERLWPTLTSIAIDHALAEPLAAAGIDISLLHPTSQPRLADP